jgi:cell wall-associated NlpC family hydrolase
MLLASFRRRAALAVAGSAVAVLFPLTSGLAAGTAAAAPAPSTASAAAPAEAAAAPAKLTAKQRKARKAARIKQRKIAKGKRIVQVAARYKGRPYRWGASGPSAFDCSGYTSYVVRKATGRSLPRTSAQQGRAANRIKRSERRVGDLVFFPGGGRVHHVGIYAGHGKIWHAPKPGSRVKKASLWTSNVFYGRVV